MDKKLWEVIEVSENIVLCSHVNPDGDTLGSMIAFYLALKQIGKRSIMFNATKELAKRYDFLPFVSKIKKDFPNKCDLLICFDSGSFKRVGIEKGDYKVVNIDHHVSNTNFGDINFVNIKHASCTISVYEILKKSSIKIDRLIATCIYVGLVEDTNFFSYNVDANVFKIAGELVDRKVDPILVAKNLKERDSLSKLRLTAKFLDNFELKCQAKVAIGEVTQKMLKICGATKSDSEHLADILKSLATVELVIFIFEEKESEYKVSLRSKGDIDVSKIASKFGGGGHKNSAGFTYTKTKIQIVDQILKEVNI